MDLEGSLTLSHGRIQQGWSSVVTVTLLIWSYVLVSQEEKATCGCRNKAVCPASDGWGGI